MTGVLLFLVGVLILTTLICAAYCDFRGQQRDRERQAELLRAAEAKRSLDAAAFRTAQEIQAAVRRKGGRGV